MAQGRANHIEVVEPTLEDFSGHCYSLVASLCRASEGLSVRVWTGKEARSLQLGDNVRIEPVLGRQMRLLQAYLIYRRLLRESGSIVVTTAKSNDLRLLDFAAGGQIEPGRVFLYFHWVRDTAAKRRFMERMAEKQPNLVVLGTTPTIVEFFRACGFGNVVHQPYPMTLRSEDAEDIGASRHLLYAGVARQDKGFGRMVDLVEFLARRGDKLPVKVQVSADHYGKYDRATEQDIWRLERTSYPFLSIVREALTPQSYAEMFSGGVCVQAYDREEFTDRVSGVTLDALSRGCPIVATEGTWISRLVGQYGAGVAVSEHTAETLYRAAKVILDDYATFRAKALAAGQAEAKRSWMPLLGMLGKSQ